MSEQITRSGIPLKQVYTPEDVKDSDYHTRLNDPGTYPYTRGRHAGATTGWIQRELSGEGEPSRSNEQLKYLIEKGQMGIDVIGDSPTQGCLDPDHPLAVNTIGTQGVSLCCLQDYIELFRDLPLESISVSSSVPPAFAISGLYLAAKQTGIAAEKLRGSAVQAPFYAEDCGYSMHMPFNLRLRLTTDSIEFCAAKMPKFHSFLEDTYFFSETGLNVIEEMALGFIEIRHVVRALFKRGLDVDSFAAENRLSRQLRYEFLRGNCQNKGHKATVRAYDEGGIRGKGPTFVSSGHRVAYLRSFAHRTAAFQ